jgi:hypothetical protein
VIAAAASFSNAAMRDATRAAISGVPLKFLDQNGAKLQILRSE